MTTLINKPLSTGAILKQSIKLYLSSFNVLLPFTIALAIFVPFGELAIARFTTSPDLSLIETGVIANSHLIQFIAYSIPFFIVTLFLNSNMIYMTGKHVSNEIPSIKQSIITVLDNFITIICAHVIILAMILLILLFSYFIGKFTLTDIGIGFGIVLSVALLVRFTFFIPLILFTRTTIIPSIIDSYQLTRSFWWRTFLFTIIAALLHTPFIMARHLVPQTTGFILQFVETILVLPLSVNILMLQFFDLRGRQIITTKRRTINTGEALINNT